jgi:hypothetical protein
MRTNFDIYNFIIGVNKLVLHYEGHNILHRNISKIITALIIFTKCAHPKEIRNIVLLFIFVLQFEIYGI